MLSCDFWPKCIFAADAVIKTDYIGDAHEYLLLYSQSSDLFKKRRSKLAMGEKQLSVYKNQTTAPMALGEASVCALRRQHSGYPILNEQFGSPVQSAAEILLLVDR